jgi:photosystem II stability/assembly factor-like uncharacterized protein
MGPIALLLAGMAALLPQWHVAGPPFSNVGWIGTLPDEPEVVYATAFDAATDQSGLFRSDDGGANWALLAQPQTGDSVGSVLLDPRSPSRLFATTFRGDFTPDPDAETHVYVSEDSGRSWMQGADFKGACGGSFALAGPGSDTVFLSLDCSNGVWASVDDGETWVERISPFPELVGLVAGPEGSLYAISYDQIFRSADGANTWELVSEAPPDCARVSGFTPDLDGDVLLVGTAIESFNGLDCGGIYRSEDRGRSWNLVLDRRDIRSFFRDPQDPSRVYAAAQRTGGFFSPDGDVYQSDDDGRTWRSLALRLYTGASQVALSPDGRRLYAATFSGVYVLPIRRPLTIPPR